MLLADAGPGKQWLTICALAGLRDSQFVSRLASVGRSVMHNFDDGAPSQGLRCKFDCGESEQEGR